MTTAYPLAWPMGWPRTLQQYEITQDGRVFSVRPNGKRHELAQHPDRDGYLCVLVFIRERKRRKLRVHRAVCETFHGPRPPGMVARHLDGNKLNNLSSNLRWGTVRENVMDAVRHGHHPRGDRSGMRTKPHRVPRGERNGLSKLTDPQVLAIFHAEGFQKDIATVFGVTQGTVAHIKIGRTWAHVTGKTYQRVRP